MTTLPNAGVEPAVSIREIPDGASVDAFIDLAWQINGADPNWVPPLRMSVASALNRRKHPLHQHADTAYFLALRGKRPVGRIAAVVNHLHNEHHAERTGFFGLFECENDPMTAGALLDVAASWLRERGMDAIRGPVNLSTNDEVSSPGVLVEGFDTPPYVMMTHNPAYYGDLLQQAGFSKARDLLAFHFDDPALPERLTRGFDRLLQRAGATIRPLEMRRFREEIDTIKGIYNSAWSRNWGFVPMTDAEFEHLAREFKPIVDPDLCLIAEVAGVPVGFSLALPDLNVALRHLPDGRLFPFGLIRLLWHKRSIRQIRVITIGFRHEYQHMGLGAACYARTWQTGVEKGYVRCEGSWILEDNLAMARPLERLGARVSKRYRIFERPL
ncbi:MAG: N-acetyltransferase [Gemmatimonadetes bacterium]|nr:N-acetyltransferase [Gemmatimonadota bacterium]